MNKYNVWLRSKPGMYEQYNGKVMVYAEHEEEAVDRAFRKLKRTTFPHRPRGMWRVDKVELIFH